MRSLKIQLLTFTAIASSLTAVACSEDVPLVNTPSAITEVTTLVSRSEEVTAPARVADASDKVFQGNPSVVTIFDVALVFAYFQNPGATPEQIVEIINALTNENLTLADFDSPFPSIADAGIYANPPDTVTLADVAAIFVAFQGVTGTAEVAAAIANLIPGFEPADLNVVPGSPSPSPSPSPLPPNSGPPPNSPEEEPSVVVNTLVDENGTEADTALKCSLREAIIANNTSADFGGCPDPKGTIQFDSALSGNTSNTIVLTAAPEPITNNVVVSGPGVSSLTISGNDQFRVFEVASTNNPLVTIEKLTLTKGLATNANGGAIRSASTGLLTIDSVTISNSTATGSFPNGRGGGILAFTATVSDSTLSGNSAGYNGGGINTSTATVSNSTLSGNSAVSEGGGIHTSTATVNNSILSGNSAGNSGGGIRAFSEATVSNSTLSGNSAGNSGGGILVSTVTVSNSTLSGNSATYGGGILVSTATVSNSTLSGNSAVSKGGGIYTSAATVSNSIISGNSAQNGNECLSTQTIVGSFNLFGFNNDAGGCPTGGTNIVPGVGVSQILNPLADNGGFSSGAPGSTVTIQTQSLPAGSPAINSGDPTFTTPPDFDQRGSGFPRIVGGTVDIGAFEVQ